MNSLPSASSERASTSTNAPLLPLRQQSSKRPDAPDAATSAGSRQQAVEKSKVDSASTRRRLGLNRQKSTKFLRGIGLPVGEAGSNKDALRFSKLLQSVKGFLKSDTVISLLAPRHMTADEAKEYMAVLSKLPVWKEGQLPQIRGMLRLNRITTDKEHEIAKLKVRETELQKALDDGKIKGVENEQKAIRRLQKITARIKELETTPEVLFRARQREIAKFLEKDAKYEEMPEDVREAVSYAITFALWAHLHAARGVSPIDATEFVVDLARAQQEKDLQSINVAKWVCSDMEMKVRRIKKEKSDENVSDFVVRALGRRLGIKKLAGNLGSFRDGDPIFGMFSGPVIAGAMLRGEAEEAEFGREGIGFLEAENKKLLAELDAKKTQKSEIERQNGSDALHDKIARIQEEIDALDMGHTSESLALDKELVKLRTRLNELRGVGVPDNSSKLGLLIDQFMVLDEAREELYVELDGLGVPKDKIPEDLSKLSDKGFSQPVISLLKRFSKINGECSTLETRIEMERAKQKQLAIKREEDEKSEASPETALARTAERTDLKENKIPALEDRLRWATPNSHGILVKMQEASGRLNALSAQLERECGTTGLSAQIAKIQESIAEKKQEIIAASKKFAVVFSNAQRTTAASILQHDAERVADEISRLKSDKSDGEAEVPEELKELEYQQAALSAAMERVRIDGRAGIAHEWISPQAAEYLQLGLVKAYIMLRVAFLGKKDAEIAERLMHFDGNDAGLSRNRDMLSTVDSVDDNAAADV